MFMSREKYIKLVRCWLILTTKITRKHCLNFDEKARGYAENVQSEEAQLFLTRLERNLDSFILEIQGGSAEGEAWECWLKELPRRLNERQAYFEDFQLDLEDYSFIAKRFKLSIWELLPPKLISPKIIKEELSANVFGQDAYLERLSLGFYNHLLKVYYPHLDLPNSSLLVCGSSGVGKTYAVQILAEIFSFPIVFVNCANLVQEGIIGASIGSSFARVYRELKGDLKRLERSVVVFDEFDKLFEGSYYSKKILTELLSVIDDRGSVDFYIAKDERLGHHNESIRMQTKNCFFLFTGVFAGVEHIVKKRLNRNSIGLGRVEDSAFSFYRELTREDLSAYMDRAELLGRISDFVALENIDVSVLQEIVLKSKSSPVQALKDLFALHGLELSFSLGAVERVCNYTLEEGLGVRGLKSVLWSLLNEEIFNLDYDRAGQSYHIDEDFVEKRLS